MIDARVLSGDVVVPTADDIERQRQEHHRFLSSATRLAETVLDARKASEGQEGVVWYEVIIKGCQKDAEYARRIFEDLSYVDEPLIEHYLDEQLAETFGYQIESDGVAGYSVGDLTTAVGIEREDYYTLRNTLIGQFQKEDS